MAGGRGGEKRGGRSPPREVRASFPPAGGGRGQPEKMRSRRRLQIRGGPCAGRRTLAESPTSKQIVQRKHGNKKVRERMDGSSRRSGFIDAAPSSPSSGCCGAPGSDPTPSGSGGCEPLPMRRRSPPPLLAGRLPHRRLVRSDRKRSQFDWKENGEGDRRSICIVPAGSNSRPTPPDPFKSA